MAITIIIEDGSGVVSANSYTTVSGCDAYLERYGEASWASSSITTTMKQNALLKAMKYLDYLPWKGKRVSSDQALSWPRSGVVNADGYDVDEDVVPQEVIAAQCELALRSLPSSSTALQPDLIRGGLESSNSIGAIVVKYLPSAPARPTITVVDDLLRGLIKSKYNVNIVRG